MSGTLPATITVTQGGLAPAVTIAPGAIVAPPPGVPPYPLATDPTVPWMLVWQDGALTWVPWAAAPTVPELLLENGAGVFLLEDGPSGVSAGAFLMES